MGHQTVLLSATISQGVEDLSELSMNNPVQIDLGDLFVNRLRALYRNCNQIER